MGATDLLAKGVATLSEEGSLALARKCNDRYGPRVWYHSLLGRWYDRQAENVFDHEWDILLILDGCRVDALASVADEYEFLDPNVPTLVSPGGGSPDWMANTFTEAYQDVIRNTVYVSGNPHTRRVLGDQTEGLFTEYNDGRNWTAVLSLLVPVWEQAWNEDIGTVPARPVTDGLIHAIRTTDADRYVAHYMQPHFPSIPDHLGTEMILDDDARWPGNAWEQLRDGDLTADRVWEAYIENLRYVLDDIAIVLDNVDGDVVITADHGNAFGERGAYGHGFRHVRSVREVPWVGVTGTDTGSYQPAFDPEGVDESVDEQLEALGYK